MMTKCIWGSFLHLILFPCDRKVLERGYCEIWGDPHYITFDKVKYNFQGDCDYTILTPCRQTGNKTVNFRLWGDNIKVCPSCSVAALRKVYLDYNGTRYALGQRHEIYVDDERRVSPVIDEDRGVNITYNHPVTVSFSFLPISTPRRDFQSLKFET